MGKTFAKAFILILALALVPEAQSSERVEENKGYTFGDLTRRLVFYLDGQPWFRVEEEIDRFVGEPWKIDRRTLAKIEAFPDRARLQLLSETLGALDEVQMVVDENHIYRDQRGREGNYILAFTPSPETEEAIQDNLERVVRDHFEERDWIDFGVYELTKNGLFFQDEESWEEAQRKLIHYAIWPALGVVLLQAVRNQTRISSSGWILRSQERDWRLGWFAKGRKLGFSMDEPGYEGGLAIRSPSTEWRMGMDDEKEIEIDLRTYFLRNLGFGDISSHFKARMRAGETFRWEDEDTELEGSIFVRRRLGHRSSSPNLVAEIRGRTDFDERRSLTLSAGVEWPTWLLLVRTSPFQKNDIRSDEYDFAILASGNLNLENSQYEFQD